MRQLWALLALSIAGACFPDSGARAAAPSLAVAPELRAEPSVAVVRQPVPVLVDELEFAPRGDRVPLTQPVRVRFANDVDRAAVEREFGVDPPTDGHFEWRDDRTLAFVPTRWKQGRGYRVHVGGAAPGGYVANLDWSFRSEVPDPGRITPGGGANVVLTFDDGPEEPRQANELLDLLARLGIRALFFPSGRWAFAHPEWVARARRDGHRVCNHTWSHVNLTLPGVDDARVESEIERGANDGACRLFRPPLMGYDARVTRIAQKLGYGVFLWDVDSRDWEGGPVEDVENLVLGRVRPGAVVLFHMHARATFDALPVIAPKLVEAGYVLSWDPADVRPGGPVNIPEPVRVQGEWLLAAGPVPPVADRPDLVRGEVLLLDSGRNGPLGP